LQEGLHRIAVDAERDQIRLKPEEVGLFEPTSMPDTLAAMNFINNFTNMAAWYGEECTLRVLRRCCTDKIARTWLSSLSDDDRAALLSTQGWERLIRRDFMLRRGILACQARAETFKWTQGRTPSVYATFKMKLLRNAGITNPDVVVREIHNGFAQCPELQLHLEHMFREDGGNRLSEYRRAVQRFEDGARLLYEHHFSSKSTSHRCKCSNGFFGTRRTNTWAKHSRPTAPKPSERRHCRKAFPSRSRLDTHLRATGHHQRKSNRRQLEHAFFSILIPSMTTGAPASTPRDLEEAIKAPATTPSEATPSQDSSPIDEAVNPDSFNDKTGYEGVTFKARGYPRSLNPDRASVKSFSSITTVSATLPLALLLFSMHRQTGSAGEVQAGEVTRGFG
jgi:hypothetical protein